MFLEAFLVILGKPGHGFTIKAPKESWSLILTLVKVSSISLHLANAELSLSSLGLPWEVTQIQAKGLSVLWISSLSTEL